MILRALHSGPTDSADCRNFLAGLHDGCPQNNTLSLLYKNATA